MSAERNLRICVYAISKNEEKFVERFCRSAIDADLILIADTGSEDDTVGEARRMGAAVYSIRISPWRFDHARNAALALIPADIDICISLDLDEVLEPGWREEIERVWASETTRLRYMYDWGRGVVYKYEKIHARHGYHWHHPCHEYPRPDSRIKEVWAETDKLLVRHLPDDEKSRGQYLDLLELSVREDPACPRNAFYYARELFFAGKWADSISALGKYLQMPAANWPAERSYAMRLMLQCHEEMGDFQQAESWGMRACAEDPESREPLCLMAAFYYRRSRWPECYSFALRALAIKTRLLVYTADPEVWGALPYDLASIAAWFLGLKDQAADLCRSAIELNQADERLRENLKHFSGGRG